MFTLDEVVPWGRSFEEYGRMFALDGRDLAVPIVGCGDGPASFNAEATRRGAAVVSVDPLYQWGASAILGRIAATRARVLEETRANAGQFVWTSFHSVHELGHARMAAMDEFLQDYAEGARAGRYVAGALPALPFRTDAFGLALCSHLLFLYTAQHDELFHVAAVRDMCRIAREVRVFPLLALDGGRSRHVDGCVAALRRDGWHVTIERVSYEFQRGGNEMLRVRRA
jgi:hypothetical protein